MHGGSHSHPSGGHAAASGQAHYLVRLVTLMSMGVSAVLVAAKLLIWVRSGSVALLASMADSALDLMASSATAFAVRYAAAPPDAEHRWGHGKAEAFASLMQAGLVFASAALVGQAAVEHLMAPHPLAEQGPAMGVMAVSVAMTVVLLWAQSAVLRRTASVAVSADRMHYLSDVASNVLALVGVGAATVLRLPMLDALSGLAVAAILLWGAITVFREASDQLLDRELPDDDRLRIAQLAMADPAVADVHQLRTRASGPFVHIQMHADLDPTLTLESAHKVVVAAEKRILEAFPAADIIIHADPMGRAEPHGGAFAEIYDG